MTSKTTTRAEGRELFLTRIFDAPPEKLFRAWTDPALLKEWFTPRPWTTPVVETDVRPGGANYFLMRGPNGEEHPCHGVYLAVEENRRLVFTDAYTTAWVLSEKPFMTVELTFADLGGRTEYAARVQHWTVADREAHEAMGFHDGWSAATEQLARLVEAA